MCYSDREVDKETDSVLQRQGGGQGDRQCATATGRWTRRQTVCYSDCEVDKETDSVLQRL